MPQERVAHVRFFDEGVLSPHSEEISLYDLISHPIMQYSLGDHVVIQSKLLPPAGIVEEVVNLAAGFVEGLVRSVTELSDDTPSTHHQRVASGITPDTVDWVGEIERIYTDGTVKVRLAREAEPPPDWTGERYTIVGGEDLIVFEVGEEGDEEDYNSEDSWIDDSDDQSAIPTESDDEWEDASEGDLDEEIPEASLDGMDEVEMTGAVQTNGHLEEKLAPVNSVGDYEVNQEKCRGFDILETVPDDHPFKSDNTNRNAPDWLARIRKEHKILQTSLPGKYIHSQF